MRPSEGQDNDDLYTDSCNLLWTSKVCFETNNPNFGVMTFAVDNLTGDESEGERELLFQCWDWERNGSHSIIGTCKTTLDELTGGIGIERFQHKNQVSTVELELKAKSKAEPNTQGTTQDSRRTGVLIVTLETRSKAL